MIRSALLTVGLFVFASAASAEDTPKLEFSQDGKDLVVKTTITVNGSSHVLWTDVFVFQDKVTLRYHVFQCSDLVVRGMKQLEITWRIPNTKQAGLKFECKDEFLPKTAQLKELLPQLEKLAAEGEKFRKDGERKKD
jgi:hypothetical protein